MIWGCCYREQMERQLELAQQFLEQSQLPDGSWPYYLTSAQGSPEATCYSVLALANGRNPAADLTLQKALNWLLSLVNSDGAVVLPEDDEPHWSTAVLSLTLTHLHQQETIRDQNIAWLLATQGTPSQPDPWNAIRMDGSLIGWSWIGNTLSWVEPTSYGLLALKKAGIMNHPRISEAEAMLFDRACVNGGWNVGNPVVWGRAIDAFMPPTAFALLALQDKAPHETLTAGLAFLQEESQRAYSTLSLALTILCFQAYALPTEPYVDLLLSRQLEDGSWRQMTQLTALSILALQSVTGGGNVFKI